ncbi:DUF3817 domain-containing protein [Arthrobacter sp. zg-Y820]|uniref:DUF3817 domain-containing protein n=1 Tax=unclassified Arthrobacter TaxID=235627 RepID=UPI001E3059CF|nr:MULTISPECIES: DUF3817 domain-containing protein [unclassified Arthrobacter]MCC9195376.1 DUF3817 domain-containing protein [Arthrobacter sp. zg-Y820]MDK1278235.1 DUF3817 domain-containing protein [Arthrobacter sp. zg.Y820]MDK1361291.1 DUF3817 domain-containing protein [Arthrobacter sp. zg-Y1219]WIB10116.1 DUF3817 domain-containing protein [Arthrobacter sp. zg-Y820]
MTPRTLFRTLAFAEAVTWTLLLAGMFAKYVLGNEAFTPIAGGLHGFVFLSYAASTVFVGINQKWSLGTIGLGLATAVIPYTTIPFERTMDRRGRLAGGWRLAPGGETPVSFPEKVQAVVLRRPAASAVVVLAGIAVVFGVLLRLGPPVSLS